MKNKGLIRISENTYGFLLKFYPKSYKQEFGEEMKYVFSKSLQAAYSENGKRGIFTLWSRIAIDGSKSLIIQHIENRKEGYLMNITRVKKCIFCSMESPIANVKVDEQAKLVGKP